MKYEHRPVPTSVVRSCLTAALIVAAFMLGVAAVQADPASIGNQATILRFTNKVAFGAVRQVRAQVKVDSGLAHFLTIYNRNFFKPRQMFSTGGNVLHSGKVGEIPSIAQAHLP